MALYAASVPGVPPTSAHMDGTTIYVSSPVSFIEQSQSLVDVLQADGATLTGWFQAERCRLSKGAKTQHSRPY